jgi:hypothetical protein
MDVRESYDSTAGTDAASASRKRDALYSRLTEGQRHGQLVGTPRDMSVHRLKVEPSAAMEE